VGTEAPDLVGARSGAAPQQASSPVSREPSPAIAIYRVRALKVSPDRKHHGIVTKNSNPMTGAMRKA
jgi:hypothetical protein